MTHLTLHTTNEAKSYGSTSVIRWKHTLILVLWLRLSCSFFCGPKVKRLISSAIAANPLYPLCKTSVSSRSSPWSLKSCFKGASKTARVQKHGCQTSFSHTEFQIFRLTIQLWCLNRNRHYHNSINTAELWRFSLDKDVHFWHCENMVRHHTWNLSFN